VRDSSFCIADLTGANANVMWETGFAMALRKPTILIGQNIQATPFDLKVHQILEYKLERLDELQRNLADAIHQTLLSFGSSQLESLPAQLYWLGHDSARAIRLAMFEPANRVELERILNGALFHLEQIKLPASVIRKQILRALHFQRTRTEWTELEQREFVGWIADAKKDLGNLLAIHQNRSIPDGGRAFVDSPSADDRTRYVEESVAATTE
jgi:hypothetical protein